MATSRLTQRRIDAQRPRKKVCAIRDTDIKGFGLRILPSGRKHFLHSQVNGRRVWHVIGSVTSITLDEARHEARGILTARREGNDPPSDIAPDPPFETVADEVFRRYRRHWKASTFKVNAYYYRKRILPWFGGMAIRSITRADVQRWFASLHATPAAADRS